MDRIPIYLNLSERIAGWTRGAEAEALIRAAYRLPDHAVIVEIGSFLGSASILLAGARKLRRTGNLHCVDPFDASGDEVSVPEYARILGHYQGTSQIEVFRANVRKAGVARWVGVHRGQAEKIGACWTLPVDMLFMDGDQSPRGVSAAFESWSPWLKSNGMLALHNSNPRLYAEGHDGHYRLRERLLAAASYSLVEEVGSTTFMIKKGAECVVTNGQGPALPVRDLEKIVR
jgi:predicted O-methyltransferase YrrM